jgi:putative endonuclease
MKGGWVYIMTDAPHGTLYIGMTADLARRITQHRNGTGSRFCRIHKLTRLVHVEWHDEIEGAILREKAMKRWKRRWKTEMISRRNPDWRDLFDDINR